MKKLVSLAVTAAMFLPSVALACAGQMSSEWSTTSVTCAELECAKHKWNVKTSPRSVKQSARSWRLENKEKWSRYPTLK